MNLREFYKESGGDFDAFLNRLRGKESLAYKYITKFAQDLTYAQLAQAIHEKNYEEIGKNAHTLKGIALNLDFKNLGDLCCEIVALVRCENFAAIDAQFDKLSASYEYTINAIGYCTEHWDDCV